MPEGALIRQTPVLFTVAALIALLVPLSAGAQDARAVQAASEAYAQLSRGETAAAASSAGRAVAAAPDYLDYRLLWADALLRSGRPADALTALEPVKALSDYRVQTRRAEAARGAGQTAQAAEAFGLAASLATDPSSRTFLTRARLLALVELGRADEARAGFDAALQAGVLPGDAPVDAAMLAIALGDDVAAQDAFTAAERSAPLSGRVALDAAYSARRLGRDEDAVRWFSQGLDTLPEPADLTAQQRFQIRREIETLQRNWGGSASISQGVSSTASSATPGADTLIQAGAEAYYRLGGYNNGRPVDVFVRAFGVLDSKSGGATGGDTVQGWFGVRWKPLADVNLNLEASRMVAVGDLARNDFMLRAAWSIESGGDLRFDRDSWPSWRLYADFARILEDEQSLGVVDGQVGRTWRVSNRDLVSAGAGVRGYYDSALAETTAIGAGPRLSWRRWSGGDRYSAPPSYVDLSIGYDFAVSGGDRGRGLSVLLSLVR